MIDNSFQQPLPLEPKVFEKRVILTSARYWVTLTPARYWVKSALHRNYGHTGMHINFVLIGPLGAISTTIVPSSYIGSSREDIEHRCVLQPETFMPMITDLSYHSYTPMYEGQSSCACTFLKGGRCYSDSTSLNEELCEGFLAGGDEWLWKKLEEIYRHRFHGEPYPSFAPEYIPHPDDAPTKE